MRSSVESLRREQIKLKWASRQREKSRHFNGIANKEIVGREINFKNRGSSGQLFALDKL